MQSGSGRTRSATGDADRRRKESVLPVAGVGARRHRAGNFSADCADGRPGSQARSAGTTGGAHSFGTGEEHGATGLRGLPEREFAIPVYRAGAAAGSGICGDAGQRAAGADCYRRGALHFAVGSRLQAGLPDAWTTFAWATWRGTWRGVGNPRGCADSYSHAGGASRHRGAAWYGAP